MNSGARILAIEDDVLLASHLQQHLSQCGFAVTLQHDGARGLAQACNEEFDLVLLDVLLPGRNGLEALAELRCRRSVPVITASNPNPRWRQCSPRRTACWRPRALSWS